MKTSKQIEKDSIVVAFQLPVELYFRMKFDAEAIGYKDMSKYARDIFKNYFIEKGFVTSEEANDAE